MKSEALALTIRRNLLQQLRELGGAVASAEDLIASLPQGRALEDRVREQLSQLVILGFVDNRKNAVDPRYAITAEGLRQINQDGRLAADIWGDLAR